MTIEKPHDHQHAFVIRLWWEANQMEPPGEWRGEIIHVADDQRAGFRSLAQLGNFITGLLTASGELPGLSPTDEPQERSGHGENCEA